MFATTRAVMLAAVVICLIPVFVVLVLDYLHKPDAPRLRFARVAVCALAMAAAFVDLLTSLP